MGYIWDFSSVWHNFPALTNGLLVTLALSSLSLAFGIALSVPLAFLRRAKIKILSWAARAFIEIFRDLPVLVVLIWLFYCLPILMGDFVRISPFQVAVIGLGLNLAALQSEIFRSGVESIPPGEIEAAKTLGFNRIQIARYIILPQAFWRTLAPTLGQGVNTLKLTALASFISVDEVFHITTLQIQNTYRPLEFYTILAGLYLALIIPISSLTQFIEYRLERRFGSN